MTPVSAGFRHPRRDAEEDPSLSSLSSGDPSQASKASRFRRRGARGEACFAPFT